MPLIKQFALICITLFLSACVEDLAPENKDLRKDSSFEIQISENFSISTTDGDTLNLDDELASYDAVVLYFTMWCSTCSAHMDEIDAKQDDYPNVKFLMVDFVSGSISQSKNSQRDNAYNHMTTLVDNNDLLQDRYKGKMASTIIINNQHEILFNEVYKSLLYEKLDAL
jgi:thiol-disulfide isomerase/thioredoxin